MRKLVMIVLATALFGAQAAAAPVNFSAVPRVATPVAPRSGSVLANRPQTPPITAAAPSRGRFGRWFSNAQSVAGTRVTNAAQSVTAANKTPAGTLVSLGKSAEAQGNIDGARKFLQQAVGAAPSDATTLRAAGHFEDRQGKLQVAESLYRRAVASVPKSPAALNDLAICLARQNRMPESAAAFQQAIALRPNKALYRNNIAKVLVELGDTRAAMEHLVSVHGKAVAHYNLGYLLSAKGDAVSAQQQYQLALAADPSFEAARNALAATGAPTTNQVASLAKPRHLPPAPGNQSIPTPPATPVPAVTPLVTGAPITPAPATAPGFTPVTPGYAPAVASPYYPTRGVQQR